MHPSSNTPPSKVYQRSLMRQDARKSTSSTCRIRTSNPRSRCPKCPQLWIQTYNWTYSRMWYRCHPQPRILSWIAPSWVLRNNCRMTKAGTRCHSSLRRSTTRVASLCRILTHSCIEGSRLACSVKDRWMRGLKCEVTSRKTWSLASLALIMTLWSSCMIHLLF